MCIRDRMNHGPSELSGGQQQRVAIARALVNQPSILFADEPTGNLDDENTEVITELIFNIATKYQKSLCLVTHDADLAKRCDRIMTIENGTVV